MTGTETILGSIVIATVSGLIGKYIGSNGKVTEDHCTEKRAACQSLILEKLENLSKDVHNLTNIVNDKVLKP